MVLIRRLKLEACCDHLSVNKYQQFSAAERRFTGEPTPRALETGDYGVALFHIESSVVNVTFVSDSSVNNDGFELLVFPFYRTYSTVSPTYVQYNIHKTLCVNKLYRLHYCTVIVELPALALILRVTFRFVCRRAQALDR